MADYQRVVEYLRDLRMNPVHEVTEEVRRYAVEYTELCIHANERLRQCSTFLQQGLRSEAIHLAEEQPNLLDMVAALDLPDAQQWAEFCQQADLPVPPPLQLDRAVQLNDAYAQDQPLEALLDHHRHMALSRAPVKDRLAVARQIAALDPASHFWERDIRVLERARIQKLPTAFYNAVRNQDAAVIAQLRSEIEENQWYEPIPEDLRTGVNEAFNRMQRAQIETDLRALLQPLHQAFAEKDVHACETLLKQWRGVMKASNLTTLSTDLHDQVQPIIDWVKAEEQMLAKQKQFTAICEDFTRVLDMDADEHTLETAYQKAKRCEFPLPDHLEKRYQDLLTSRSASAKRRHIVVLAGIGGAVVAIILIVAGILAMTYYSQSSEKWVRSIQAAVNSRNPALARQIIQDQEKKAPQFNSSPALVAAKKEADDLQAAYDRDAQNVANMITRATALETANRALVNSDKATIDTLLAALTAVSDGQAHLKSATDLAWADPNRTLEAKQQDLDVLRNDLRQKIIATVRSQAEAIAQQLDMIPATTSSTTLTALNAAAAKLNALRDPANLDDSAKTQVADLLTRIEQQRTNLDQTRQQYTALVNLAKNSATVDQLQKAIEQFNTQFPNTPIAADLTRAQANLAAAKAIEVWQETSTSWNNKFAPANAAAAQKRLEAIQAYLTSYPTSPFAASAATYNDYLKQATDAMADKGTWQTAFADMLGNPMYAEMGYMDCNNGLRYYTLGEINKKERRVNERVSVTFEAIDPKNLTKRKLISVEPPVKLLSDKPKLMAHAAFVTDMAERIKTIDENNWDTWGVDAIDRLLKADDIDLVVKAVLLQQILKTNDQVVSWALADLYERAQRDLTRQNLADIIWYDTDHPVTDSVKQSLKRVFDGLPKTDAARTKIGAKKAQLAKDLFVSYHATGVLYRDDEGTWTIAPHGEIYNGNLIWTTVTNGNTTQLVQLGQYQNQRYTLNQNTLGNLPQGTMVFFSKP